MDFFGLHKQEWIKFICCACAQAGPSQQNLGSAQEVKSMGEPKTFCVDLLWVTMSCVFPLSLFSVSFVQVPGEPDRMTEKEWEALSLIL